MSHEKEKKMSKNEQQVNPSEKNEQVLDEDQQEAPELKTEDVVEVSWDDAQEMFLLKTRLSNLENYLAELLLSSEKRKASLLSQIATMERSLYESANYLRDKKNIDPSVSYELKLPQQQGEKAYFLRKDEQ